MTGWYRFSRGLGAVPCNRVYMPFCLFFLCYYTRQYCMCCTSVIMNFDIIPSSVLGVPSQVTDLSLSKAVSSGLLAFQVTWTTPQSDEPISHYHLQYRIHGTTSWDSQYTISGLSPRSFTIRSRLAAGSGYDIRLRAVSALGAGNWSAVQTERTYMSAFL